MRRAVVALCIVGLQIAWAWQPAGAAISRPVAVTTVPPAYYGPPFVVMRQGMSLLLVQLDPTQRHDIVSRAATRDRRPLFASRESLSFGEAQLVPGVERLLPGAYPFTCSIHPFMYGQLLVER